MTQYEQTKLKSEKRNDHYVPKTYLKHFSDDQNNPGHVWRYWKNNPHVQNPKICKRMPYEKLCRVQGGDYNPHFRGGRPLDKYFDLIENQYNEALRAFENGDYNAEAKACIAHNIARMRLWAPKRKALVKVSWEKDVETLRKKTAKGLRDNPEQYASLLEYMRKISQNPDRINAQTLAEDLESSSIK